MFEITGEDIALLSDEDLRSLVGYLCEAELGRLGLPRLNATWGGNQNASDGGVDVRVDVETQLPPGCLFARPHIGYQVKAEDMSGAKIVAEMKPDGAVRSSILELAAQGGSYIIVSSKGSVTDSALTKRKRAMMSALDGVDGVTDLHLDFYDRSRIASWVRDHAGIVTWVRMRVGRPISGWRPYGDWAASQEGLADTYLIDDSLRIQGPTFKGEAASVLKGMEQVRENLAVEGRAVRLVGLSGVGKTRFVQALFDDRIGVSALAPDLAIYTNLPEGTNPQPIEMLTQLVVERRRHVLIVDNCTPELHRKLAEVCKSVESRVSLLTVEYDVREDQPESTEVFELQPSSDDLIEKLLQRRVTGLSQVNAKSIAAFANGNARVALALAHAVDRHESVASLKDAELFERLFHQRHQSSSSLLLSAQACSLAYSFQGVDIDDGPEAELCKLAATVGKDASALHIDVGELKRRDLVQQRGVWRAILPHAIANRLAAMALESIPPQSFDRLIECASPRLLKSISRRLGFLHTSSTAQSIVSRWLADGGLLGRAEELDETKKAMLQNTASVDPAGTIDAIERAMLRARQAGRSLIGEEFRTLLLSLAFDAELFERCVSLILDLIEFEEPGRYANQVRNSFPSLFHLWLSGTHASVEQRCKFVDGLLRSNNEVRRELGFASLEAMLQTTGFSSFHPFEFGARSRDYGWHPEGLGDVVHWFKSALALCSAHDAQDATSSIRIRRMLGLRLHSLWTQAGLQDEVESICREFRKRRFWPEGWAGLRSIRRSRDEPLPADEEAKLAKIEAILSPQTLIEQVRAKVLRSMRDAHDDIGYLDWKAQYERQQQDLIEIGKALASERAVLDDVLDELTACGTGLTLGPVAKGLVDATQNRRSLWDRLLGSFHSLVSTHRSPELLVCFLVSLQSTDAELVEVLLTECLDDPVVAEWFPYMQLRVVLSAAGLQRLKESLVRKIAPAARYEPIWRISGLGDSAILELVPTLVRLEHGFEVSLEIIHMRILQQHRDGRPLSPELIAAGRIVLEACEFDRQLDRGGMTIRDVIVQCLNSADAVPIVRIILARLREAHANHRLGFTEENPILSALFAIHPVIVLNNLFVEPGEDSRMGFARFVNYDGTGSPLDAVPEATLLAWCDEESEVRYPLIAEKWVPFSRHGDSDRPQWKPSALALLERAPNKIEVLKHYIHSLGPMIWSGSRSATWEANVRLLDDLENYPDASLATFARQQREELKHMLEDLRRHELASETRANERFE